VKKKKKKRKKKKGMIGDVDDYIDDEMMKEKITKKTTVATMTWFPLLSAMGVREESPNG
jgi:hypothetical protein